MLTFDEARHEYRWNGKVVPSVTQILKPCYDFSMVAPDVLERKRTIGVAVHRAVELDIADDLERDSLAPEIEGYFSAWRAFREAAGLHAADFGEVEVPLFNPRYGFAGTPDMAVFMSGEQWCVLDVKTAEDLHPAVALQTAAYKELLNENAPKGGHKIKNRFALRLRANGTYRLDRFSDPLDWTTFLSFLTTHRWREANLKGTTA